MKKNHYSIILYSFVLYSLISCVSMSGTGKMLLLPVDNVIPGVTSVDEIRERGKSFSFIHPNTGKPVKQYWLNNFDVVYEDDVITSVIVGKDHVLPVGWTELGLSREMDYFGWMERLQELGFLIQVYNYPVYTMDNDHFSLTGHFSAFRPENPLHRYELRFEAYNESKAKVLESRFTAMEINLREENWRFFEKLMYPQKERIVLPEVKREAIAYSGLLGEVNNSYQERLEPFDIDIAREKARAINVLADSWEIESAEELRSILDDLKEGGHSASMLELLGIIEENRDVNLLDYGISNGFKAYKIRRLIFLKNFKDLPGLKERSLRAWDFGRSISLCRWGYNGGYISEVEAWERILEYRVMILGLYNSWEDYAANYTLGRMFWASGSSKIQDKGNDMHKVFIDLTYREDSVWNGPWNMEKVIHSGNDFHTNMGDIIYLTTPVEISFKHYLEGVKFYNVGLYGNAEKELTAAMEKNTEFMYPNVYLGFYARQSGNMRKAVEFFRTYYKSNDSDYFAALYYGEALEEIDKLSDAISVLKAAVGLKQDIPYVYKSLARIYLKQKDFDQAGSILLEYDNSVTGDTKSYYADFLKGSLAYETGDYPGGIDYLQKCYKYYDKDGYINFMLGSCYLYQENGQYDMAYLYLSRALDYGFNLPDNIRNFIMDWENDHKPKWNLDPLV